MKEATAERPARRRCPLCRDRLNEADAAAWRCGACATVYHGDCAAELGGCSTLGCPSRGLSAARDAGPAIAPEPAPTPDPRAWSPPAPPIDGELAIPPERERRGWVPRRRTRAAVGVLVGTAALGVLIAPSSLVLFTVVALTLGFGAPLALELARPDVARKLVRAVAVCASLAVFVFGCAAVAVPTFLLATSRPQPVARGSAPTLWIVAGLGLLAAAAGVALLQRVCKAPRRG